MKFSDDPVKRVLATHDDSSAMRRLVDQIDAFNTLYESSGMSRLLEEAERQDRLVRAALGPSEEIRKAVDALAHRPEFAAIERAQRMFRDYEQRFRLPAIAEAARLMAEQHDRMKAIGRAYCEPLDQIQRQIEAMRSPWLDAANVGRSIGGLASLHGIGQAVLAMEPFGQQLSEILRADLGDWRDAIRFPASIAEDTVVRTELYVARGLDTSLTDFPALAFNEALDATELRAEPPSIIAVYGPPVPASGDPEEEEGFVRTNMAHDWLQRMERLLREFIDTVMTAAHGPNWPRHRLPNGLCDTWQEKKAKAEKSGANPLPLIAYADFTDYEGLICRRDNWPLFEPTFRRQDYLREILQRLHPVRLATMHARAITQDDELYVYVEVRRLTKAIKKS